MLIAVWLMMVQGTLGAFDTLYYHEWRARLPSRPSARRELLLHGLRDLAYAALFASLGWRTYQGALVGLLALVFAAEIVITLWDFVEEDRTRKLDPGERVMHAVMAMVYGAFVARMAPELARWSQQPTGLGRADYGWCSWVLTAMAVGVFASGLRDLYARAALPAPVLAPAPS